MGCCEEAREGAVNVSDGLPLQGLWTNLDHDPDYELNSVVRDDFMHKPRKTWS